MTIKDMQLAAQARKSEAERRFCQLQKELVACDDAEERKEIIRQMYLCLKIIENETALIERLKLGRITSH